MSHHDQHCEKKPWEHEQDHLCSVILRKDFAGIKALVKDSQFFCKNCGRAAHSEESLCNPSKI